MVPSESPGALSDEYGCLDAHWEFYRKRRDVRLPADLRLPASRSEPRRPSADRGQPPHLHTVDTQLMGVYEAILENHMPPSVLVDENRSLIRSFGGASRYLRYRDGRLSTDLLDMVDPDLRMALAGAMQRARKSAMPVVHKGLRVRLADGERLVNLSVKPIRNRRWSRLCVLISIEELGEAYRSDATEIDYRQASDEQLETLETELRYTKDNLQATIEELETSNEELQAANEELVASNEELQSTNKELHSVNEELYTVNAEYQKKTVELTELTPCQLLQPAGEEASRANSCGWGERQHLLDCVDRLRTPRRSPPRSRSWLRHAPGQTGQAREALPLLEKARHVTRSLRSKTTTLPGATPPANGTANAPTVREPE